MLTVAPLIQVLIVLLVVGVLLFIINRYVPMEPPIKGIFTAIVLIAVVLWLLSAFGVLYMGPGCGAPPPHPLVR